MKKNIFILFLINIIFSSFALAEYSIGYGTSFRPNIQSNQNLNFSQYYIGYSPNNNWQYKLEFERFVDSSGNITFNISQKTEALYLWAHKLYYLSDDIIFLGGAGIGVQKNQSHILLNSQKNYFNGQSNYWFGLNLGLKYQIAKNIHTSFQSKLLIPKNLDNTPTVSYDLQLGINF